MLSFHRPILCAAAALTAAACGSRVPDPDSQRPGPAENAEASSVALTPFLAARLRVAPRQEGATTTELPVVSPSAATGYRRVGAQIVAEVPRPVTKSAWHSTARAADVALAATADGEFVVADGEATNAVSVRARLVGAAASRGEIERGYVVYPDAMGPGVHLLHRPHLEGTEDYVYFSARPATEALVYEVDVRRVAGLRLVPGTRTLEFLDATGDPRLRIAPPYLVDADGQRRPVEIRVTGCAVDTDARTPWARQVTAPRAASCRVELGWSGGGPERYPLIVDPAWATTGSMASPRYWHCEQRIWDAKGVFQWYAMGGLSIGNAQLASVEVFSGASWASAGALTQGRDSCQGAVLRAAPAQSVSPAAVGGAVNGQMSSTSVEIRDPATGVWKTGPAMNVGRRMFSLTRIGNDYLAVGGGPVTAQVERWQYATATWSLVAPLTHARWGHVGLETADSVLVAGGMGQAGKPLADAEVYDVATKTWQPAGTLPIAVHLPSGVADGVPVVVGGDTTGQGQPTKSVARLNAMQPPIWTSPVALLTPRRQHAMVAGIVAYLTFDGQGQLTTHEPFFVIGGKGPNGVLADAEVLSTTDGIHFGRTGPLNAPRYWHSAMQLNGKMYVTAGLDGGGQPLASSEVFTIHHVGESCVADADCDHDICACGVCIEKKLDTGTASTCPEECNSGFATDGVCCDALCDGDCEACSAAAKGQGADGACGPVKSGLDPKNKCEQLGSGNCALQGFCDGNGVCANHQGAACGGGPTCQDPETALLGQKCASDGNCAAAAAVPCGAYKCEEPGCLASCQTNSDCKPPNTCQEGSCVSSKPLGQNCSKSSECTSKVCGVEGVCCNDACDSPCVSCLAQQTGKVDGQCHPVVDGHEDPKGHCKAESDCGPDGKCDGKGVCRSAATPGTACKAGGRCEGGFQVNLACDGKGTCADQAPNVSCGSFLCDGSTGQCFKACKATETDCAEGNVCNLDTQKCVPASDKTCADDHTVVVAGKATTCPDGTVCKSGDCVPAGSGSGGAGASTTKPGGTTTDVNAKDGCGCRAVGTGSRSGGGGALLVALLALGVRRRARRAELRRA